MNTDAFLGLLQFSDGLFPAGAYAHSFGLEFYVQAGSVRDAAGVESLIRTNLEACTAPTDAVALLCAWKAGHSRALESCLALDATLDAIKAASELRNASRQMGRQTLRIASNLIPNDLLQGFYSAVGQGATAGHHAIALGVVGSVLQWSPVTMASAYLYATSATLVNAALRLVPLGQLAGQRILWNLQPLIQRLANEAQGKDEHDIWSFAPALEIASMHHATLEARLFRS